MLLDLPGRTNHLRPIVSQGAVGRNVKLLGDLAPLLDPDPGQFFIQFCGKRRL